jgi:hypothetical protein
MVLINFFPRKSLTSKIYNHKTALVVACYVQVVVELCLAVVFGSVVVVTFENVLCSEIHEIIYFFTFKKIIIFHGTFIFVPANPYTYFMVLINFFPKKSLTSKICNHKTALAVGCYVLW